MSSLDWEGLLDILDYHHRKWYENIDGHWCQITWTEARKIITKNIDEDVREVAKKFAYRDTEAHMRPKDRKGGQLLLL